MRIILLEYAVLYARQQMAGISLVVLVDRQRREVLPSQALRVLLGSKESTVGQVLAEGRAAMTLTAGLFMFTSNATEAHAVDSALLAWRSRWKLRSNNPFRGG